MNQTQPPHWLRCSLIWGVPVQSHLFLLLVSAPTIPMFVSYEIVLTRVVVREQVKLQSWDASQISHKSVLSKGLCMHNHLQRKSLVWLWRVNSYTNIFSKYAYWQSEPIRNKISLTAYLPAKFSRMGTGSIRALWPPTSLNSFIQVLVYSDQWTPIIRKAIR